VLSPFAGAIGTLTNAATGEELGPMALPMAERDLAAGVWRIATRGPTHLSSTQDVTLTSGARVEATAWNPFVKPLWTVKIKGAAFASPALADLDGDHIPDAIVGVESALRVLSGKDGHELWSV